MGSSETWKEPEHGVGWENRVRRVAANTLNGFKIEELRICIWTAIVTCERYVLLQYLQPCRILLR